jgi:hypothetical protein
MNDRQDMQLTLQDHLVFLIIGDEDPAFLPHITEQLINLTVERKIIFRSEGHMTPCTQPHIVAAHINKHIQSVDHGTPQ